MQNCKSVRHRDKNKMGASKSGYYMNHYVVVLVFLLENLRHGLIHLIV